MVCGGLEKRQPDGDVIATEFEVFRCGASTSLLTFGALETCLLHAAADRLVITQLVRWPFGPDWKWVDKPAWEYVFTAQGGDNPSKRMVLELPHLSAPQVEEALKAYSRCEKAGRNAQLEQREEAIGRVLVAALAGDAAAQKVLFSMSAALDLDGHAEEVYNDAIGLYDAFASGTGRVPKRPGA